MTVHTIYVSNLKITIKNPTYFITYKYITFILHLLELKTTLNISLNIPVFVELQYHEIVGKTYAYLFSLSQQSVFDSMWKSRQAINTYRKKLIKYNVICLSQNKTLQFLNNIKWLSVFFPCDLWYKFPCRIFKKCHNMISPYYQQKPWNNNKSKYAWSICPKHLLLFVV